MQGRVKDWFQKCETRNFGIELPNGWVGRPFDNMHMLDDFQINETEIFLKFDEMGEIRIFGEINAELSIINNNINVLTVDNFLKLEYLWYSSSDEIAREIKKKLVFDQGTLNLYGYNFDK